jgi:hypothetical protein
LCVCVSSDIHIEKHSFFIPLLIPLFSTPRDLVSWTLITTGGGHASVWPQTYVKHMSRKPLSLSLSLSLSLTHKNNAFALWTAPCRFNKGSTSLSLYSQIVNKRTLSYTPRVTTKKRVTVEVRSSAAAQHTSWMERCSDACRRACHPPLVPVSYDAIDMAQGEATSKAVPEAGI